MTLRTKPDTGAAHTPWSVSPHTWPAQVWCCPLVGRPYSVHGTDGLNVAAATTKEIAILISAAPEMLAALRTLDSIDRGMQGWHDDARADAWAKARAALAKATGAQS